MSTSFIDSPVPRFSPMNRKRTSWILSSVFFPGLLAWSPHPAEAATLHADSCSLTDVRSAAETAARGDTVIVPSGSCSWDDRLDIDKAVILQGSGSSSCDTGTCITSVMESAGRTNQIQMIRYTPSALDDDTPFRITGFRFDAGAFSPVIAIDGGGLTAAARNTTIRIDNNHFGNILRTEGYFGFPLLWIGNVCGVVDSNVFDPVPARDAGAYVWGSSAWQDDTQTYENGTPFTVFFEDNTIIQKSGAQFIGAGQGGHYVMRYNDIDYTQYTGSYAYAMDTHGHQGSDYYAGFGAEAYGNRWLIPAPNTQFTEWRGGKTKTFYNKAIATDAGARPTVKWWTAYGDTYEGNTGLFPCPPGTLYYPSDSCSFDGRTQYPQEGYAWGNFYASAEEEAGSPFWYSQGTGSAEGGTYPCPTVTGARDLRPNVDFWIPYADYTDYVLESGPACDDFYRQYRTGSTLAFTGEEGIGCGALAERPAACTEGAGYWVPNPAIDPTAASCSDITGWYGKDNALARSVNGNTGTLYRCSVTGDPGTWEGHYTPYAYPHPLRGEGGSPPAAPASLTVR